MAAGATRKTRPDRDRNRFRNRFRDRFQRLGSAVLGISTVLGVLTLVTAGVWKLLSLPVERVVVTGDLEHVSRDELMSVISGSISGGFLWLDLQAIRQPLERLPWVHRAVVRRQWPDSIEVRVIEQRAIAAWGDSAYLNHAGEVFQPEGAVPADRLPALAGPPGSQGEVMMRYKQVQERLQPLGLTVVALDMNARGGLLATLAGGGELVLGRSDLEARLDRLELIYRRQLLPRRGEMARVDLRYSHGAAVSWKQLENVKNKNEGRGAHGERA